MSARQGPDGSKTWRDASLWAAQLGHSTFPALTGDRDADVVVIGAGLAGLLTATLLADAGANVLVLDRHDVGGVATRNTTAKVTALQGVTYRAIVKARGAETAAMYATAQLDAVEGLRALIGNAGIDCNMTVAPAFTYATELVAAAKAREELDAARSAGVPVEWVEDSELPFPITGAVRLDDQFHIDPGRLCAQLAISLGPDHVAEHTAVVSVEETDRGCSVITDNGSTVRAAQVVVATQGPIVDPALLANRCTPMQSYCVAGRMPGPVPQGMYLSCDDETRSLRPATVDGEERVVVGGAGHHMGDGASDARWDLLTDWASQHLGGLGVTHRWATHDLVPTDHVPFIGRLSARAQRRWVATGFAKWGMTNSYVAARLISEAIGGGSVDWSGAFDPTRIASTVNRELVSIGVTATHHLVGDRLARRPEPRCTHQGCVLRRDDALGTWDCPCHGSRFDQDGSVIQGPASSPLAGDVR
jgi:glycine/D-amino acid oxidase-like deaminating enzyme